MKYRKLSHSVYYCAYHLVLATKYCHKIFNDGILSYMNERLKEIGEHYPLIEILEINHDKDHIHLMVMISPKMSVGEVVRIIKSNTSRDLKKKFPFLKKAYWGTDGVWSDGYFVSTVGVNEEVIRNYKVRKIRGKRSLYSAFRLM